MLFSGVCKWPKNNTNMWSGHLCNTNTIQIQNYMLISLLYLSIILITDALLMSNNLLLILKFATKRRKRQKLIFTLVYASFFHLVT